MSEALRSRSVPRHTRWRYRHINLTTIWSHIAAAVLLLLLASSFNLLPVLADSAGAVPENSAIISPHLTLGNPSNATPDPNNANN